MESKYISSEDLTPREIQAGLSDGTLRLWRYGSGGQQWFERTDIELPIIRGISSADEALQADAEEAQAAIDLEIAEQELQAARERFARFLNGEWEAGDE